MMPCGVPLLLAMRLRKWLRRRIGRKAGNAIGKVAIIGFGCPPFLFACIVLRLVRLMEKLLDAIDRVMSKPRQA
jgi:hypothetical protein